MISALQQQQIKQLLQSEIECINSLSQSLEQEYEALAEQHAEALENVVRSKQQRIQQLEVVSRQREQLLGSIDSINVSEAAGESKQYQFDDQQLTVLWNELVSAAENCRDKNRVNGSIVELVSRQSRHALDILHGIAPGSTTISETYNNEGQTKAFANKRSLVHV